MPKIRDPEGYMNALHAMVQVGDTLIAGHVQPKYAKAIASYLMPRIAAQYGRGQLYTACSLFARSGRPKDELRMWSAIKKPEEFENIKRWMNELGDYFDGR